MPTRAATTRSQNPRGQGERLREEILAAARRLLEERGVEDAVTMRAVARDAGVTAPAIYPHFASRQEMIEAVIDTAFAEYADAVHRAIDGIHNPVHRLRRGCRAYIDFAHAQPATFRILFDRHRPSAVPSTATAAADVFKTFVSTLAECAQTGQSRSQDPYQDAVRLWVGLHGLATLPTSHPRFAWPDQDLLLNGLLKDLAKIHPRNLPRPASRSC